MKRWVILLICLLCWGNITSAEKLTSDNFSYTKYTNPAAGIITGYSGNTENLDLPTVLGGTVITELEKIENNYIKTLYIPSGIKLQKNAIYQCKELNCLIIEDANSLNDLGTSCFIYQSASYTTIPRSIIIFSNPVNKDKIINNNGNLSVAQSFTINYSTTSITFSLYINGSTITQDNFNDIAYALSKHSITPGDVTSINATLSNCTIANEYNPRVLFPNATIEAGGKTYKSIHPITDLADFTAVDESIVFDKYQYTRNKTANWNSVCLPFPIKESMFPSGTMIYTLNETQGSGNAISLKRIAGGETELSAGVPCYIKSTAESWSLTIPKANVTANVPAEPVTAEGWQIVGSFTEAAIAAGEYKLNTAGSAFGITTSNAKVYPYRCYLHKVGSSPSPARLSVSLEEPDGTTETVSLDEIMREQDEALSTAPQLYDLFGRPRSPGSVGIFVRPTRH